VKLTKIISEIKQVIEPAKKVHDYIINEYSPEHAGDEEDEEIYSHIAKNILGSKNIEEIKDKLRDRDMNGRSMVEICNACGIEVKPCKEALEVYKFLKEVVIPNRQKYLKKDTNGWVINNFQHDLLGYETKEEVVQDIEGGLALRNKELATLLLKMINPGILDI
jgi:hypothetical protein